MGMTSAANGGPFSKVRFANEWDDGRSIKRGTGVEFLAADRHNECETGVHRVVRCFQRGNAGMEGCRDRRASEQRNDDDSF